MTLQVSEYGPLNTCPPLKIEFQFFLNMVFTSYTLAHYAKRIFRCPSPPSNAQNEKKFKRKDCVETLSL